MNGVAQRAVCTVKEGTAVAPVRSGRPEEWWHCAMECCCYFRTVHDRVADGKTTVEKRYGKQFDGPFIPFGALVESIQITAMDKARVKQLGKKVLKGICFGYVLRMGGGWSGDLMMADYEDLQQSEASEINVKRFKTQGVFVTKG